MQSQEKEVFTKPAPRCLAVEPCWPVADIAEDVRNGLLQNPRSLPPKYFYDEYGARLFERICDTPEYYPTRTEDQLLQKYAEEIIEVSLPRVITELGAGSSRKTRRLFDACEQLKHQCSYAPFDVCEPMLIQSASELENEYNWLTTTPLLGDYHAGLANLPIENTLKLFVFLGSTIGNFEEEEMMAFISDLRQQMHTGDFLLLGADRVKDKSVLDAAYNDAEGITEAFNLNVLRVLNRETGSNFETEAFQHQASFNTDKNQIEMHLLALRDQEIDFKKLQLSTQIMAGERILTEISRKFEKKDIESCLQQHGFEISRHFEADDDWFSLVLARAI